MNFDHEPGAQLASDFQKCPRTFAQNRWASGEGVVRKHGVTRPKADPIGALGIGKLRDKSRRLPLNIQQYRRTARQLLFAQLAKALCKLHRRKPLERGVAKATLRRLDSLAKALDLAVIGERREGTENQQRVRCGLFLGRL